MERPRFGKVVDAANKVVTDKEQRDAANLISRAEIARVTQAEDMAAIEREAREEIARLNENGKHDHEEVFVGTNIYTSGRRDIKPKLSNLKGEKWVQKGE